MNKDNHQKDIVSDPARNDEVGSDWSSEGGSTPSGPATHTDSSDAGSEEADKSAEADKEDDEV